MEGRRRMITERCENLFTIFSAVGQGRCKMDELKAGVERAFAVFPEAAGISPARRRSVSTTQRLGHDGKGVEFAAFGDLHRRSSEGVGDGLGKRFTGIASIDQHTAHLAETGAATPERLQGAFTIGHLGGGHGDGVGQALGIDGQVTLDAPRLSCPHRSLSAGRYRCFFTLCASTIRNVVEPVAPLSHAGLANLIF